jgi:LacI family transcriptional regulator
LRRVSVADIMRETGLSRATIDRVLNGRGRVHPRTREAVEATLQSLRAPEVGAGRHRVRCDVILRIGRGMMGQMRSAWDEANPDGRFLDMYQASDREIIAKVIELSDDPERALIITAKNSEGLVDALRRARARGKRIIALVSDLHPDARDGHVGIDNRAAGQTAAYLIGRALGDRPMR